MVDGACALVDATEWNTLLDKLAGPLRTSLARSMAVAGGTVIRDEAKTRAPRLEGTLAEAIYLAFKDAYSTPDQVRYSVTWNSSKAPHGHLIEFGHWQIHPAVLTKEGEWVSNPKVRLARPKWVAAHPFLRPAYEASQGRAMQAMVARGRERLPELLASQEVGNGT